MADSFFKKKSFKIIERQIVDENMIVEEKNQTVFAYDFTSWKLVSNNQSPKIETMASLEKKIIKIKEQGKNHFGLCVTTVDEILVAQKYAEFLYIPGEFCRQSDLLAAAKNTSLPLIVEKGIFLSPSDIIRMCEKIQGSDYSLVECGSANGYSDCVLDPRSLYLMKQNSKYFGISLSDLLAPEGAHYAHRSHWLSNPEFINAFIETGKAFHASFFVTKNYGHGKLDTEKILAMVTIK